MFDLSKAAFNKSAVSNLDTARKIPVDEIFANDDNFYSIAGIEELAESIKMVGLLSPVNVVKTEAGYKLISGHRRLAAFKLLRGGDDAGASSYDCIPAVVVSGLDDLTETMALITANSTARELTYAEKCKQEDVLRKTLLAMRDAGREIPKNLGQYIADQLGVSRNEVSRMHSVNRNLTPEAKAKLEDGELTAQQAYELSRKPAEDQNTTNTQRKPPELTAEQKEIVMAFLSAHKRKIGDCILPSGKSIYAEVVSALRSLFDGNRGWFDSVYWVGHGSVITFLVSTTAPDFSISYKDLTGMLALCAIRSLADSHSATSWDTGDPPDDGSYVCKLRWSADAVATTARVLYRVDGVWMLDQACRTKVAQTVEIVNWIKLPD